ncbi:hypothetical protein CVT25_008898 [Psilocybe cyanescens]|uniref:Uncharacterized protein n=1 Tax=Psilocybe cyanescens TaxID=93625 RepID=A0A409XNG4_PSICY|nr:hypothetical protein CVT25_008898 [Psilocybe cyanescens]
MFLIVKELERAPLAAVSHPVRHRQHVRAMPDLLGSTLTSATVFSFFTRYGKRPYDDEINNEQAVMCENEKMHMSGHRSGHRSGNAGEGDAGDGELSTSTVTSVVDALGLRGRSHWSWINWTLPALEEEAYTTEPLQMPLRDAATGLDLMMVPTKPDLSSDDINVEEIAGVGAGSTPTTHAPGAPVPVPGKTAKGTSCGSANTSDSFTSAHPSSASYSPSSSYPNQPKHIDSSSEDPTQSNASSTYCSVSDDLRFREGHAPYNLDDFDNRALVRYKHIILIDYVNEASFLVYPPPFTTCEKPTIVYRQGHLSRPRTGPYPLMDEESDRLVYLIDQMGEERSAGTKFAVVDFAMICKQ